MTYCKRTYWTKEICKQKALEYQTRRDFYVANINMYVFARKHGFLNEICQHMIKLGNRYKKCIYSYEFPDRLVYVGLTFDFNRRKYDRERNPKDPVTQYIIKTGLQPIHIQLTDYFKVEEAVFLEGKFVEEYKNHNWHLLNKAKTGATGKGIIKWTYENCIEDAKKYNSVTEWAKNNVSAYISARKHGWLKDCCVKHMRKKWSKRPQIVI